MSRKRYANFVTDLIVIDEPQLIKLQSGKSIIVALAVPSAPRREFDFIAVSVTEANWERYMYRYVDLHYLFTYPTQRSKYVFSSDNFKGDRVPLTPYENPFPEDCLPSRGLFSDSHTHVDQMLPTSNDDERLFIDGDWELNEFGKFYEKYAEVYLFNAALTNVGRTDFPDAYKGRIKSVFSGKPFRGGSSYVQFFDELAYCLPKSERLSLEGINYNSPGDVRMKGLQVHFDEVKESIANYWVNRNKLREQYRALYGKMSKDGLLKAAPATTALTPDQISYLDESVGKIAPALGLTHIKELEALCGGNSLVRAKVILAVFRRVEAATSFFAEGRMSYNKL